jgi:geranylgeranyl diphosphate synthase, type II
MAYSLFPGGKRLRPILAIAACRALGGRVSDVLPVAASIEMVHTYSLIHDDLPALDNDDLRRGRATSHRVFGEAMAILAGDALLTHAFEVAASHPQTPRLGSRKVEAIGLLARAAGVAGMIGGQVMDLETEGRRYSYGTLSRIHRDKTGALISASVQIGGIMAGASRSELKALRSYGDSIGLAFQIVDDILDREGDPARLGKSVGKDAVARKATFPALLGLTASRRRAEDSVRRAGRALERLGARGRPLRDLSRYILNRAS